MARITENDTTMIPAAMASRNLSCQNDRHRRVWSAKYSHHDGMTAVNSSVMNAIPSEATVARVHVHSQSLRKALPRSTSGASRSCTRFGTGSLMGQDGFYRLGASRGPGLVP